MESNTKPKFGVQHTVTLNKLLKWIKGKCGEQPAPFIGNSETGKTNPNKSNNLLPANRTPFLSSNSSKSFSRDSALLLSVFCT